MLEALGRLMWVGFGAQFIKTCRPPKEEAQLSWLDPVGGVAGKSEPTLECDSNDKPPQTLDRQSMHELGRGSGS